MPLMSHQHITFIRHDVHQLKLSHRPGQRPVCLTLFQATFDRNADIGSVGQAEAEPSMSKRGYVRLERDAAPSSIASTAQFRELCPDSAVLMHKRLGA